MLYIYIYIHVHAYIHTYIHTYVRTYVRTYVHTYIHTYIHTYMYTHTYCAQPREPLAQLPPHVVAGHVIRDLPGFLEVPLRPPAGIGSQYKFHLHKCRTAADLSTCSWGRGLPALGCLCKALPNIEKVLRPT